MRVDRCRRIWLSYSHATGRLGFLYNPSKYSTSTLFEVQNARLSTHNHEYVSMLFFDMVCTIATKLPVANVLVNDDVFPLYLYDKRSLCSVSRIPLPILLHRSILPEPEEVLLRAQRCWLRARCVNQPWWSLHSSGNSGG
jgi:hypothetical protein